jgi:branched-chain amino acid transport system ATP-binding protein
MHLQLRDVDVAYDKVLALKSASIAAERGEIVALIGANGAGKTTTMRAITRLTRIKRGEIISMGSASTACRQIRSSGAGSPWCKNGDSM